MTTEEIAALIEENITDCTLSVDTKLPQQEITIPSEKITEVCSFLKGNQTTFFDTLSCLTGIDNGPDKNTMEVIYHLYSIPNSFRVTLKVVLDRQNPHIPSVVPVWRAADWHEREAYDLVGMTFDNHPDLRRILSPDDWVGHPLQKDYTPEERYHGIKVKYEKD
ncbi:NADH-quinone oxidoreductase subunit C [Flammeovirga kamogawensis]|uniref:NADH-quinone oxidoreductase subunit C n=1 Tax=Flammeovirga kamogawensis TaxID=373891 RepID=A0ABX8GRG2_9BACT|nr:NADH-quinone oxidoreductase subunit C [Flammeovirga kamogawensis]MBB6462767.1 NADH-quinone oxidoreductase subunit C [Flammeovirga kamogawensis]QWG06004.1 NADH-quinone oxidoreductase subunit C [Flammeovirga kamogawensis]TRX67833.1 NADH-quinone oxidoreductase subunit C [Flammeovirga kamogawensis]